MSLSIDIDVNDHFSDKELAEYLEEKGWTCVRNALLPYDDEEKQEGVSVNFGLFLKDEELKKQIEEAFRIHGYTLTDKLKQLK